jgi:hypothetical protein
VAIPSLASWSLGDNVTSSKLQQDPDALTWLLYKAHGTYGQVTTAQTIANDTAAPVLWNANVRQYKITHSTVSNTDQVIPQEPGLYRVTAKIQWTGNATGYRKLWAEQNGSSSATEGSVQHSSVGAGLHSMEFSGDLVFNGSTDYVRIMVRQTSGGGLDLGFGEFNPRLNLMWLSAVA